MSSALQQLILDVGNLDHSIRFYAELLGLELRNESKVEGVRVASLKAGAAALLLVHRPEMSSFDRSGGLVLNFDVVDLRETLKNLATNSVVVLRGLEVSPRGEASVLVADPDGYAVLLSETQKTVH